MPRTAVIAGVGPGLGASLARTFVDEGCQVALFARSGSYIDDLAADLGEQTIAVPTDVTDREQVRAGFETTREAFGPVDVLVNHASGGAWKGLREIDPAEFEHALRVGAHGGLYCSQEAVEDMLDAGGPRGTPGAQPRRAARPGRHRRVLLAPRRAGSVLVDAGTGPAATRRGVLDGAALLGGNPSLLRGHGVPVLMSDWREELERERAGKNEFFGEHPHSPIPDEERSSFGGLRYFEPDPDLRFELELDSFVAPSTVTVETTRDGTQRYEQVGEFAFTVDGTDCTLIAFQPAGEDDESLWVPFRDGTNGEETYEAGRYLDLGPEERAGDRWVLDLNRAYNPFCAFSDAYECPLVPTENWLDVRIEAGEKYPPRE